MEFIADGDFANKASQGIVLVDFYASWCMPCLRMEKQVEEFASNNPNVTVYKYNVDKGVKIWNEVKQRHNVRSIPFVVFYKDGEPAAAEVGYKSTEELQKIFNDIVSGG